MASFVGALLTAVACHGSVDPVFPGDAIPFEPLAPYLTWWSLVESCSGLTGDFDAVHWYTSSGVTEEGRRYSGAWVTTGNRIVLAEGRQTDGGTVRHEMLHALVRESGHPHEYFVLRCGPLTPCEAECGLTEPSRGVPPDAAEVTPHQLVVSLQADPAWPHTSVDDGWFRITISVTNPLPDHVWVRLAGPVSFSYTESQWPGNATLTEDARWAFLASETRRYIFDTHFPVGTYTLYGAFSNQYAPPVTVTVRP